MDDTLDWAAATARKRQPSTRSTALLGKKVRCISLRWYSQLALVSTQCLDFAVGLEFNPVYNLDNRVRRVMEVDE